VPFNFSTAGGTSTVGVYAEATFTITSATPANGTLFKIGLAGGAPIELTVQSYGFSENTDKLVNCSSGSAETNARRVASALSSRIELKDAVIWVEQSGANWLVRLKYSIKGQKLATIAAPSPYIATKINGLFTNYIDGYGLAYQVYSENENGEQIQVYPAIGEFETITPQVGQNGLFVTPLQIDIEKIVRGLTSVAFPMCVVGNAATLLPKSRKRFWIKYAMTKREQCNLVFVGLTETAKEYVYHAALNINDYEGICPYGFHGFDDAMNQIPRRFLTRRCGWCICMDSCDWLAVILNDGQALNLPTPTYAIETLTSTNGVVFSTFQSQSVTGDGVYQIPSGTRQLGIPANTSAYKIRVLRAGVVVAETTYTIDACCALWKVYFLNNLGGWDNLDFSVFSQRAIKTDLQQICCKSNCLERQFDLQYGEFAKSGLQTVNVKGFESVVLQTEYEAHSACAESLMQSFMLSPMLYFSEMVQDPSVAYESFVQIFKSAYVKSVDVVTRTEDGRIALRVEVFFGKQLNGIS
jgi:hypothetical protein